VSRSQRIVVVFFGAVWLVLLAILVMAPTIYDASLAPLGVESTASVRVAFLAVLAAFLVVIGFGVIRGWRWSFWLVLIAFAAGILRIPASTLQLAGVLPLDAPAWYAVLQACIGAVQFVVATVMWREYREAGIWGRK